MKRRGFLSAAAAGGLALGTKAGSAQAASKPEEVYPGVWRFRIGQPEAITPVSTRHYPPAPVSGLPKVSAPPVGVAGSVSQRGCEVRIPLRSNEIVYGLGLQLQSVIQRGSKKRLRVNADPKMDTGDSHAPVPFYVTTAGYGVLVDTARYATFYCGGKTRRDARVQNADFSGLTVGADALPTAYRRFRFQEPSEVLVDVPGANGIDVYVFAGPTMREAVQRYNLFSGGGRVPPRWGLGMWYRVKGDFTEDQTMALAGEFRERKIPCDVLGLEPGWQTHAYSCTFVWDKKFPEPAKMARELLAKSYRLNLWEHAFTHPDSPIRGALEKHSGDYEVWGGLVPDFLQSEARKIFADYHEKAIVDLGVSGFKLDECDNSDFTGNWSWPEVAKFPSGADGEQMHCLFGLRYQDAIQSIFEKRKQRTYGLVRSSGALAAPYPFVLYSDLYDHKEFIRGVVNMGFSGILWTPELRNAENPEDLIRRLQTVVMSPMALINGWYIKNPPWKQVERHANNADKLADGWEEVEAKCRRVMELRMRLIPYLHAAFARYSTDGLPPFRALVMDYPEQAAVWAIEDQYLMGDALMVAPLMAKQTERQVYLPPGEWFDFWSGEKMAGGRRLTVKASLEQIPVFVKSGTLLPLAEPTLHTDDPSSWKITVQVYGERPAAVKLYEDEGIGPLREVTLRWERSGTVSGARRYSVTGWKVVG